MLLKLKNGESLKVKFWSFVKCTFLSQIIITIIISLGYSFLDIVLP